MMILFNTFLTAPKKAVFLCQIIKRYAEMHGAFLSAPSAREQTAPFIFLFSLLAAAAQAAAIHGNAARLDDARDPPG